MVPGIRGLRQGHCVIIGASSKLGQQQNSTSKNKAIVIHTGRELSLLYATRLEETRKSLNMAMRDSSCLSFQHPGGRYRCMYL